MSYTAQLYSKAAQMASQGSSPAEKQLNAMKADIWLMKSVDQIGGKNYDSEIALAEHRLGEFEDALQSYVTAGSAPNIYKSKSEVKDRGGSTKITSLADFSADQVAAIGEGVGSGPSPLGFSLLADAYQGGRKTNVVARTDDQVESTLGGYRNAMENLANATDFRSVSPEEQAKIMASDTVKGYLKKVQDYENMFGNLQEAGLTLDVPVLTRDANGNFSTAESAAARNRTTGRLGEGTTVKYNEGTKKYDIVGRSGDSYGSFATEAEALKQQNIMSSGGTADADGAFAAQIDGGTNGGGTNGGGTTTTANGDTPGGVNGGSSTTTTDPTAASAGVDPADKDWIDGLYQKYFDRNASSAELTNWAKETPDSLETFMKSEASKYGYTSKYFKDSTNAQNDSALAIIDNSTLPDELKTLWKTFVNSYTGVEVNQQEILDTFAKIKQDTIDPYFKGLTDIAVADLKNNFDYLDRSRQTETEAERAAAGQSIRQAKDGLEAAGRTFTGLDVEQLGAESAYAQQPSAEVATPTQEPFGGMFYEGDINQQNRLLASSSKSRYEKAIADLGTAAESKLGSDTVAGLGTGLSTVGGVQGDLKTEQQAKEGDTLSSILTNYYEKQNLNTNQPLST